MDGTELRRQERRTSEQPNLQAYAASACVGAIKGASDLKRAIRFINSPAANPELQASLKSAAALAILRVRSEDDESLAMAVAEERAASGTHLFKLDLDHGPLRDKDYDKLALVAAEGVLGDLAAGEANIGSVIGQFGLTGNAIRDVLQWRAVNGAAGKAVEAGMPFEEALRRYGFHYGRDSTRALASKADAASASAPRRTATPLSDDERAFVRDLVQINNARGVDGIRGREGERVTWLEENQRTGWAVMDGTELRRQERRTSEQPNLQAYAASACVGAIKGASDLKRAIQFIHSPEVAPGLRAPLKSATALAILRVRSEDDKSLAMAVAEERAASGTHHLTLERDHGSFSDEDFDKLALAAAEGVLGDLAAGEAHIGSVMGQFGLFGNAARNLLQWRAVNGAAGKAVEAGMPLDEAVRRYGFYCGRDSTRALASKADAARMEGNRRAT